MYGIISKYSKILNNDRFSLSEYIFPFLVLDISVLRFFKSGHFLLIQTWATKAALKTSAEGYSCH